MKPVVIINYYNTFRESITYVKFHINFANVLSGIEKKRMMEIGKRKSEIEYCYFVIDIDILGAVYGDRNSIFG